MSVILFLQVGSMYRHSRYAVHDNYAFIKFRLNKNSMLHPPTCKMLSKQIYYAMKYVRNKGYNFSSLNRSLLASDNI